MSGYCIGEGLVSGLQQLIFTNRNFRLNSLTPESSLQLKVASDLMRQAKIKNILRAC